ncbi:MAG: hypothetical protein HOO06_10235 [Bdellovibrionaceae bacterium]|jgi:hypothetical protein|nr:hypothetical protein [Pseudobdellovibrionaceae bacterium]
MKIFKSVLYITGITLLLLAYQNCSRPFQIDEDLTDKTEQETNASQVTYCIPGKRVSTDCTDEKAYAIEATKNKTCENDGSKYYFENICVVRSCEINFHIINNNCVSQISDQDPVCNAGDQYQISCVDDVNFAKRATKTRVCNEDEQSYTVSQLCVIHECLMGHELDGNECKKLPPNTNNTAPVAVAQNFIANLGDTYSGQLVGSDLDADTLTFSSVTDPNKGTLNINADGSYIYTALSSGADSFSFLVNDGSLDSAPTYVNISVTSNEPTAGRPILNHMGLHVVKLGDTFQYQPKVLGEIGICRKDLAHDDVTIDPQTCLITWDTSNLKFGRGFYIRLVVSNSEGESRASMVLHVDNNNGSKIIIAGQNGVSPYLGVAGRAMKSGDTLVIPDGVFPVSVSGDEKYENAFKMNAPTQGVENSDGTPKQMSTLISFTPGEAIVDGKAQNEIPKQKNAFQLTDAKNVAIVGFVIRNVRRESFTSSGGKNILIDFIGAAGAGTNLLSCNSFNAAGSGWCSNAGFRINSASNVLVQNTFGWADSRYSIMTRTTSKAVIRRSYVRKDAYRGDQPYGGFSHYCDNKHKSIDNFAFDSLAVAAPHYKNYAGISAYPATGCENSSDEHENVGFVSLNNDLSLSLMDSKSGQSHLWSHTVSYGSVGTCTPQNNYCANLILQSDKNTDVSNATFMNAQQFNSSTNRTAFNSDVSLDQNSVIIKDVSQKDNMGSLTQDYLAYQDNGADTRYFYGKQDLFYDDTNIKAKTSTRRWPSPGEDIIAKHMRSYDAPAALKVGGGTIHIKGDRGATASNETISEYFWGALKEEIPPLVIRVKKNGAESLILWEPLKSYRAKLVSGWKVYCMDDSTPQLLATFSKSTISFTHGTGCSSFSVTALYGSKESGFSYTEQTMNYPNAGGSTIYQE